MFYHRVLAIFLFGVLVFGYKEYYKLLFPNMKI